MAQLVVVLDGAVFRSARADLGLSSDGLYVLFCVYLLAFGGLLPLSGRVVDLVGRRRVMLVALAGFATAAVLGGLTSVPAVLICSAALQGGAAAFLLPAALALVVAGSTEPNARRRALGIYAAVAGSGSALGVLLVGVLVEDVSRRWSPFAGALFAVIAAVTALGLPADRPGRPGTRLDVPGALLGAGGLGGLTFGFGELSRRHGFVPPVTASLVLGVILLAAFLRRQTRRPEPLLPPYLFGAPGRTGCLVTSVLAGAGLLVIVPVFEAVLGPYLGYRPEMVGVLLLPLAAAVALGSTQVSARLLDRVAPRVLIVGGLLTTTLGLLLFTRASDAGYAGWVLPGMLLAGGGAGVALVPVLAVMTEAVPEGHSGAASAALAAAQHTGVSLGTVLLGGLVHVDDQVLAFPFTIWWACGFLLLAALVAGLTIKVKAPGGAQVRP
ncbi:MFS transporter [Streptomyces sp. NBC_01276]